MCQNDNVELLSLEAAITAQQYYIIRAVPESSDQFDYDTKIWLYFFIQTLRMRVDSGLLMTHDSYNGLAGATLIIIIIEVSLCVEKWSVITYKFEVIGLCLSISIFYYFILPSATVWRQTLNFLVHYIYLISFVTSYSADCLLHQSQAAYFLFNLYYQQSDKEHFIDSDNQINAEWLSVPIHAMFLNIVCIIYFYFGYSSKKNFPEKVLWYL